MDNDISSTQLATRSDTKLKSIKQTILNNISFLEELGPVIIKDFKTGSGQREKVIWMNMYQAWYIVSILKNTVENRKLKIEFIKMLFQDNAISRKDLDKSNG